MELFCPFFCFGLCHSLYDLLVGFRFIFMKTLYKKLLLFMAVFGLFFSTKLQAQTWTYDISNSGTNVGNPGGVRTLSDASTTGGTNIHYYDAGPNGNRSSTYNPTNYWSMPVAIPFAFDFYGSPVDSFCVSKNGLLTFTTSVAGSAVASGANTNASLPSTNLPDSTIAYFWENNATSSRGSNDNIYTFTFGTSPNRQFWVQNFSYRHGALSYSYFAVVFDEASNEIYIVDESYHSGTESLTVGVQLSSSNAVQVTTGMNSTAGSPNIVFGSGGSAATDNEYYIFDPKLLVTDDMAVDLISNPTAPICTSSDSIKVKVTNEGTNSVTAFDVVWSVNGTSQSTYSYAGTLASGASTTINLGNFTYGTASVFDFLVYAKSPNGNSDNNNTNDTIKETIRKGLDGTYTVGTSTSDFPTLTDVSNALASAGVCGPTTFNIASGTYTGSFLLSSVTGMSSTNTVTFQSDPTNTTMPLIQFDASGTSDNYVVKFIAASNFVLDGLHLKSLDGSYGRIIDFSGINSDIVIKNCKLEGGTTSSSSTDMAIIYDYSGSTNLATDITISNNEILNGSYGIYNYGSGSTLLQEGWIITENTISNYSRYGMYNYYNDDLEVSNNTITTTNTGYTNYPYGIYLRYCDGATRITGNTLYGQVSGYGIYQYYCDASSSAPALIANNLIQVGNGSSNWARPIYSYYSSYQYWYQNTAYANSTNTSNSYAAARFYYSSSTSYPGNEMKNNIFANVGGGYALYIYNPSYIAASDYNVIYSTSTGSYIYASSSYSSLSAYQTGSGLDGNSLDVSPPFTSSTDGHLSDGCYNRVPTLSLVSTDVDGETRNVTTTHPGADEVPTGNVDVGVSEILSPSGVISAGTQTVKVVVKNYGVSAVTSFKLNYQVDGGSTVTQSFTVSMASCTADTLTFSTGYSVSAGCHSITAWTSEPNSSTDDIANNDASLATNFGVPMAAGTYTIGGTGGDYASFNEALEGLECAGISGPVVFDVASGTYSEQLVLETIPGMSSTNTVTFQSASGNATMPLLQENASTGNYVVQFNGISYVTFKGIHMKTLNTSSARVIEFSNANSYITLDGCTLESQLVTSSSSNGAVVYDYSGSANMAEFITIKDCEILYGSYGIYNYGSSSSTLQEGWVITGNTIKDFTNYGSYNYYQKDLTFSNNTVSTTRTYTSSPYRVYVRYCDGATQFNGNTLSDTMGGYGIYQYYCDGSSTTPASYSNNFIRLGNGSSTWTRGIYSYYSSYQYWLHNTVYNHSSNTSSSYPAARFYYSSTTSYKGNVVKNNIFYNSGGYAVYFYNPTYLTTDNNVFYRETSGSFIYAGSTYTSLLAYQNGKGTDLNSLEVDPIFDGTTQYHVNNEALFAAGATGTGVTTDLDGNTRPATPSIGVQELFPDINVMSVTVDDTACGTSNNAVKVTVTFKNEGNLDLQEASFKVSVDGSAIATETAIGPFARNGTYSYTFTSTVDLSGTTDNVVSVSHESGDVDNSDNSANTTVPYWAIPESSFTNSDSCLGDAMEFITTSTVATGSITNTTWDFGDGNSTNGDTVNNTYASSGAYTVTITSTSSNGCVGTSGRLVNVLTELMAGTIAGNATICYNTMPAGLTSTTGASGSAGAYAYQWQSSSDDATWSDISGETGLTYNPGVLTSTTYYRRAVITDIGCGPSYTASVKITVYNQLMAGTISSDQTICYNTTPTALSQTVNPTGGDGSWTYRWQKSTDGTTWTNIAGAVNTTYAPGNLKVTTHYRLVTTGGSSCGIVNSNAVTINVYGNLTAGSIGNPHSVCPQESADPMNELAAATGGDGTYTYQWQSSTDNTTWSDESGATGANYTSTTNLTVNTYYRRNTTSGSGCGTVPTNSVLVKIAPLPVSSFILANHCFNDVVPVTNNSTVASGSITGYYWDFGDGTTSTAKIPSHVYTASGIKNVKLRVTSNIGCLDSSTGTVNVSNVPTPTFTNVYDCSTEMMLFKNATSVNCGKISAFFWDFGDGSTSTTQHPQHTYASAGTYTVKFKIFLPGGFEDSISRDVVISEESVAGFTADDECFGDSVHFVNTSTNATGYFWDFKDKTSSTLENPIHFFRVTGSYKVQLITTDGNGCGDTTSKSVTVKVRPSVYFTTDDRCVNKDVPFFNGTLYAHSYSWAFGDGNSSTTTATNFTHAYSSSGSFNAKLIAYNNNGCRDSFYSTVDIHPNPSASFTVADVCTGAALNVNNTSTSNHTNSWDMGNGTTFSTSLPSGSYAYSTAGTYTVSLAVASINGCKDTASSTVVVYDTPDVDFAATSVCSGDTTQFTNMSTGGSGTIGYTWDFGDGSTSSLMSPSHAYTTSGKYTVTLSVSGDGGCTSTQTKVVEVYTQPTVSVSTSDVCIGETSNFVATTTGASTYKWSFGDGNVSGAQSPNHVYASTGTYGVSLTVMSANGCTSANSTSVEVYSLPSAGFTTSNVCLGKATSFTNTSTATSGTLTYSWDFGDGLTSSSTSPTHTYAKAGTYTVILVAHANGCSSTASKTVTVNGQPDALFTTGDVCLGEPSQFANISNGATSYSWDFGDGNSSSVYAPSHTYSSSGTYTVELTASSASGCSGTWSQKVSVSALPKADFSASDECEGETVSFTNNSSSGDYHWAFGDGAVSEATNPSHGYKNSGNYSVSLEVEDGNGCANSTTQTVTIFDAPNASFTALSGCEGSGLQFTNTTSPATGNTYSWTFGDASSSSSVANPSHTYASDGSYTVTLSVVNADNCSDDYTQVVEVAPRPAVSFTAADACERSATVFKNNSDQGANVWAFGNGTTSRLTNPSHIYGSAGTYNVQLTVTNPQGCTNSATNNVTVNPNPVAQFTATPLCTGPNVSLTNNSTVSSGSIASSQWMYGDGSTGTTNGHNYAQGGAYYIRLAVTSDKGCVSSRVSNVKVYDAPVAAFSTKDVCLGEKSIFVNQSSFATSSSWTFGDGATSTLTSPTHTYGSANTYAVTLTASNPIGCTDMSTINVVVSANPVASFTAPDGCANAAMMFTNTSTGSNGSVWTFGDGGTSTVNNASHTYTSAGSKTVTLTAVSAAGCVNKVTNTVTVNASPVAGFRAIGNCEGAETRFLNASSDATVYAWSFGDGNTTNDPDPMHTYGVDGDYRVLLIASNANCIDSMEQIVPINPSPNSDFTFVTSGREVSFTPVLLGAQSYNWNFDDGTSSTDISAVHRFVGAVTQTFNVCLNVTGKNGCMSETCQDVDVDLVGVNDLDRMAGVSVYPNPNQGVFIVKLDGLNGPVDIAVTDVRGASVLKLDTSKLSSEYTVDVTGVKEGVYFVSVRNGGYTTTQRVVITR